MYGIPYIVSDVMTQTVAAVGRRAPFKETVRMMQDWQVSALPVIEGEGRVVGVVSEADLLPGARLRDDVGADRLPAGRTVDVANADALTAGDVMSSPAVTVRAAATLAETARIMARHEVKRLPVVDEAGLLAGVVSRADLLKVFLRDDEDIAEEVRREIAAHLFRPPTSTVEVEVHDGVVTVTGKVRDAALVALAARLIKTVEGVVDVEFDLAHGSRVR
ncbi:CBS domain-containing protein [Streptomyces sp. NPDC048663]|uniref:CBS domain-containing protein n=1 Tax=Streptomyces sp. NPDC048663 TaxID=3155638 RepID=UPI00342D7A6D